MAFVEFFINWVDFYYCNICTIMLVGMTTILHVYCYYDDDAVFENSQNYYNTHNSIN